MSNANGDISNLFVSREDLLRENLTVNRENTDVNRENLIVDRGNEPAIGGNMDAILGNLEANRENINASCEIVDANRENLIVNRENTYVNRENLAVDRGNEPAIGGNMDAIPGNLEANRENVGANSEVVDANRQNLVVNRQNVDVNRGNLAVNPGNVDAIGGNMNDIFGNVLTNRGNVDTNRRTVDSNRGNHDDRETNQRNRNVNQYANNNRRGDRDSNRANWRGNQDGNRGSRGGNDGSRGDNRYDCYNQDQRIKQRGQIWNRGNSGSQMPPRDMFNMKPRDQSEDRQGQNNVGNMPFRRGFGGRFDSIPHPSLNDQEQENSRREGRYNDRGRGRPRDHLGFKILENFYDLEPDALVVALTNKNTGLEKLLETELSNDFIVLILRVLTKMCESSFQENRALVFSTVCQKKFIDQLKLYISSICTHDQQDKFKNKFFWNQQERFWNDLLNFYENVLKIIPNTGCEHLQKIVKITSVAVHNIEIEQSVTIPSEIKDRLEHLQAKITTCLAEREKNKSKHAAQGELEPPDNFRLISLYPTISEITSREKAFIRANITEGKYRSVEHYLDVQFRLLREDFIAPLRDGICNFLQQSTTRDRKRNFNVHFYRDVHFVKTYTIQDKIAVVVQLPTQEKLKLKNSRKFMFGSLVCFTNNNFQSIIFGTVASSKDKELIQYNRIAVDIGNHTPTADPYIMVEYSVFFEPYYHVLKALQTIGEDNFPLKRYIIDVVPDVNPPSYLNRTVIEHANHEFYPLVPNTWPSHTDLGLDSSQYRAFRAALTKEFCVIQGPPGTGKTFIGLKVAQVLLENMNVWNKNRCPILVICFTNHALDQFLEGILKFTTKLVRIGGQSKSEKLEEHNIKCIRRNFRETDVSKASAQLTYEKHKKMIDILKFIKNHQILLDTIYQSNCILNFKKFEVIDANIKDSWFKRAKNSDILDWLMRGRTPDERYEERRRNINAQIQTQLKAENGESDSDDDILEEEDQEHIVDDRDEILIETENINTLNSVIVTINTYIEKIHFLEKELTGIEVRAERNNTYILHDEKGKKEEELHKARDELEYLKWRMDQFKANKLHRPINVDYNKPHLLKPNDRWGLYFNWLRQLRVQLIEDLTKLEKKYRRIYRQYEEVKQIEDTQIMREMLVIGMTTTGAARYQSLLQALKCPIVIVEEAAEVLESHVVVSLTNDCKHLILIGDHQQLRPTTAEFQLAKHFNLDISLFERMVNNKIHCEQLEVQHRMRPEIARLIVPSIYPKLENHHTVESYPPIHGVTKNLFFITHREKEEAVSDTGSRKNVHEAKFLIALARYFIYQGYEPEEITILAPYLGQKFCLAKERKKFPCLENVRITVVDNFQGEESKIILLSLVRSNEEDNVGFLKIDNRVCVALSRAKEGMYIIGNMDILEKSSSVWRQIKTVLEENDQFGTYLTLQCQVHTDQLTCVTTAEDFHKITEGGCSQLCKKELNCGHICSSTCHIIDREHLRYKCNEKCTKILCELNHVCPDFCFEECKPCRVPQKITLKCGHTHSLLCHMQDTSDYKCSTLVAVDLDCGHRTDKPCHQDKSKFACPFPCEIRLLCGHACTRKCHVNDDHDHLKIRCFKPCHRIRNGCSLNEHKCMLRCYENCHICEVEMKKTRSCGHVYKIQCHVDIEGIECRRPCKKKLPCGHNCKQNCSDPCKNCSQIVRKKIPECDHEIKMKCCETPDRKHCKKDCLLLLPCGHRCNKRCNQPCQDKCKFPVDNSHNAVCGHQFKIPCYKTKEVLDPTSFDLLQHCTEPCGTQLLCEHRCSGTCGSCAQGRVHTTCREQCGRTLVCGHPCAIPCSEMCQPCKKICSYRCGHSRCGLNCGEPCKPCIERCLRSCKHVKCSKLCHEPCDVPPCTEPCRKRRNCKHPCIGYCGDPCPPVCRICDPNNKNFEVFFGSEDEPDARFVYLSECGHIVEANAMEQWLAQAGENGVTEINVKHCPKCKSTLTVTQRYSEYIKEAYIDINKVKKKWFGQEKQNEDSRVQLQQRISDVEHINKALYSRSNHFQSVLQDLQNLLKEKHNGKRNPLNIISVIHCQSEIGLIENLVHVFSKGKLENSEEQFEVCLKQFEFILQLLNKKDNSISKQRATDIELEINKFERLVQLCTIEKNPSFKPACATLENKNIYSSIKNILDSCTRYSAEADNTLKSELKNLADAIDKSVTIIDEERRSIVKAMQEGKNGLGKGRWFKCPNGHPFAIGECGGAMQVSKCVDCGVDIGGQNHALLSTNVFAAEMDEASHPAYSNAANLDIRNFQFD